MTGEERELERVLDKVEERLVDAPLGFHQCGAPTGGDGLGASALSNGAQMLWRRWNGMELANGEVCIFPVEQLDQETKSALGAGLIRDGDVVIGARGADVVIVSYDPWEEGAEVLLVDDDGGRSPSNASVASFVLAQFAEFSVLYDEEGEFQEGIFGDDGELTSEARRRLLRRHLDFDSDAPLARLRLGQLLRDEDEVRAARREFSQVLKRAPNYAWAQFEEARAHLTLGERDRAQVGFKRALELEADEFLRVYFLAWSARAADSADARAAFVAQVEAASPEFSANQHAAAREALEHGQRGRAAELIELGLCISPRSLGLLELRGALDREVDDGATSG